MARKKKIRVVSYGLGPIGIETARLVLKKSDLIIVGAVDIAKEMVGKDLGQVLGLEEDLGVKVTDRAGDLFRAVEADVVLHTAGSRIRNIYPELEEIVLAGLDVISSSEELLYPVSENADLARAVDRLAKKHKVTVLGTGVNPGFVMDALPLFLTGVCQDVQKVHVERYVDAGTRRFPLQRKVGAGMTPEEFREKIARKELGHVGLIESFYMIAQNLGMSLDTVNESIEPVISEKDVKTAYFSLKPGDVAGIKHTAEGIRGGEKIVTLDLRMFIGCEDPHDSVRIAGNPAVNLRIDGGIAGDQATAAVLVNYIPVVASAKPGLATVNTLPAPHFRR
jgi:4-hydroxy-tetrahydrodipicolinate reductase